LLAYKPKVLNRRGQNRLSTMMYVRELYQETARYNTNRATKIILEKRRKA